MHRFFAAFLSFLALYGTGEASNAIVIDAPIPDVRLRLSDFAEVVDGADVAFLDAYEQSRLLVTDGKVSFLTLHDHASAVINGGEISWIHLHDRSVVRLTDADSLGWLVFHGADSRADIVANNVSYEDGVLKGSWANGATFSFWAIHEGLQIPIAIPPNIFVTPIPEPSPWMLFALSVPVLLTGHRSRSGTR